MSSDPQAQPQPAPPVTSASLEPLRSPLKPLLYLLLLLAALILFGAYDN